MSSFRHAARWIGAAVAGVVVAAGPALPSSAAAPIELASSSPAADQSLSSPPSAVRLQFNQQLEGRDVTIGVGCNGTPANTGAAVSDPDGRSVEAPLSGTQEGTCNVTYTVASVTGAPITGSYEFTIEAAPEETTTTVAEGETTAATTPDDTSSADGSTTDDAGSTAATAAAVDDAPDVGGPLGLARFFSFVGVLALFGALVLIALHWHEGVEYLVTLRYLRVVWIVGAVATVFVVVFSTARLPGNSVGGAINPASWGDLFDTTPGKALLARLLLVLACGWVAWQPDRVTDPATQLVAIALPGLAVVTLGFSRSGGSAEIVGYLGGIVQALGASIWFGGLMLLTRAVLVGPGEEDLVHAVRGFCRLAPPAIVATLVGGLIQVWRLDGLALLTTGHGRLAILSFLAIGVAIYLGTATRQFAQQRLGHADHLDGRIAHRLRRAFTIELLVGGLAILFTAWMLAFAPAKLTAAEFHDDTTYEFTSPRSGSPFDVRLQLSSTRVGPFGMRLEVFEPSEGLSGLQVKFVPPPEAYTTTPALAIVVPLDGAGAAVMDDSQGIGFAVPGAWTVDISAQLPDGSQQTAQITGLLVASASGETTDTTVATAAPGSDAATTTVAAGETTTTTAAP